MHKTAKPPNWVALAIKINVVLLYSLVSVFDGKIYLLQDILCFLAAVKKQAGSETAYFISQKKVISILKTIPMNLKLLLCLLLICVSACDKQSTFNNLVDTDINNYNKQLITEIINGDSVVINRFIASGADSVEAYKIFEAAKIFRNYQLQSSQIIGFSKGVSTEKGRTETINYEYKFNNSMYAYFFIEVGKKKGIYSLKNLNIKLNTESLSERAAFTFKGKGVFHYICFTLAILIPAFIIYTIIITVKTTIRRKWLWILLIIVFNFPFYFNWYSGKLRFESKFQILGLGIEQGSINEPWTFAIAIPLGAIIFWVKRRSIIKQKQEYEELVAMYQQNADVDNP